MPLLFAAKKRKKEKGASEFQMRNLFLPRCFEMAHAWIPIARDIAFGNQKIVMFKK